MTIFDKYFTKIIILPKFLSFQQMKIHIIVQNHNANITNKTDHKNTQREYILLLINHITCSILQSYGKVENSCGDVLFLTTIYGLKICALNLSYQFLL